MAAARSRARDFLNQVELAATLAVSRRTIQRWSKEGLPRARRRAKAYPRAACLAWRDAQLRDEGARSVRPATLNEARQRKLAATADLAEMERDERRAQLVPVALYRQEYEGACSRLRAVLLNAPTRYAPQLLEALAEWLPPAALRKVEPFIGRMMAEITAELEAGDDVPADDAA